MYNNDCAIHYALNEYCIMQTILESDYQYRHIVFENIKNSRQHPI